MLKQIYCQRYGKLLLGFCLILVLIYAGMGWDTQRSWHNQRTILIQKNSRKISKSILITILRTITEKTSLLLIDR